MQAEEQEVKVTATPEEWNIVGSTCSMAAGLLQVTEKQRDVLQRMGNILRNIVSANNKENMVQASTFHNRGYDTAGGEAMPRSERSVLHY